MTQESLQRNIENFLHSGRANIVVQIYVDAQRCILITGKTLMNNARIVENFFM